MKKCPQNSVQPSPHGFVFLPDVSTCVRSPVHPHPQHKSLPTAGPGEGDEMSQPLRVNVGPSRWKCESEPSWHCLAQCLLVVKPCEIFLKISRQNQTLDTWIIQGGGKQSPLLKGCLALQWHDLPSQDMTYTHCISYLLP